MKHTLFRLTHSGYLFLVAFLLFSNISNSQSKLIKRFEQHFSRAWAKKGVAFKKFEDENGEHAYRISRTKKPLLVLVHGFGMQSELAFFKNKALLQDFDLLMPDLLWHGQSKLYETEDNSIQSQVDHLYQIILNEKITEPFVLVGHSYGGIVSSYFAEQHPELVKKLVLYDSPACCYSLEIANKHAQKMGVENVQELLAPTSDAAAKANLATAFHHVPWYFKLKVVYRKSVRPKGVETLDAFVLRYLFENAEELEQHHFNWKMPVYLIWGKYDELIPLSTQEAISNSHQIPKEHCFVLNKSAHAGNYEQPRKFNNFIRSVAQ
jgi:pimeloyl-ACP methyl ester carboxylesterase